MPIAKGNQHTYYVRWMHVHYQYLGNLLYKMRHENMEHENMEHENIDHENMEHVL